jgi:hypothetical protein
LLRGLGSCLRSLLLPWVLCVTAAHPRLKRAWLSRMAETVEGQPVGCIFAQFTSPGGEATGPQIEIPLDLNTK